MTVKTVFLGLGAIFLLCVASTIGFYAFNFRALEISSSDPAGWAQFGAYFSGILSPTFALINLLVIVYIAIRIKELQETQLSAKRLTLDLYKEWHEEKLHKSRIEVDELITKHKVTETPLPTLSELERDFASKNVAEHAFRVYHFFEKWAVLASAHEIDNKPLAALLGTYTEWWRDEFFERLLERETDRFMKPTLQLIFTHVLPPRLNSERLFSAQPGATEGMPEATRP
jgi:hypothetical protein